MRALLELLRRLGGSLRHSRSDADLEKELRLHLELAGEQQRRAGGMTQAMDALRDQRGLPWLDALRADVVFGWRQIRRHRVASAAAVLSLSLAMGAALASFRLVDAVLLRPLPVTDPGNLFVVTHTSLDADKRPQERDDFDYPTYRRYVERAGDRADVMLVGMAVRRTITLNGAEPENAVQQFVSGNMLPSLGVQPALGRLIGPSDDRVPGGHPVAVLTHDYWQRRFGGSADVAGRTFRMAGGIYTVIGVTHKGFTGTEPGAVTDFFVPSMMNPEALNSPGWSWFRVWTRPKNPSHRDDVRAQLQAAMRTDQAASADDEQIDLQPAGAGASGIQQRFRQPLWILAGLAAMLVLVACANVANLLLARATTRKIEMALRLSIGAARRRLIQLLVVESTLLAIMASAAGALFAAWAAPFVVSMLAPPQAPVRVILDLDWRTVATAASLTFVVTVLFGLTPAVRASAVPLIDALRETRGQRSHRRLTDVLVLLQAALCVFVLFGASLFIGSLNRLQTRPLGFSSNNLVHVTVESSREHSPQEWAQLVASLQQLPRIESVAVAGWAPLTGNRWRSTVVVPGRPVPELAPNWVSIGPGYLHTMQMRLVEGRDFRADDRQPDKDADGRPIPGMAIVNERFARVYFDGRSPVGQHVIMRSSKAPVEIVGVVADAVYFSIRETSHPAVYVPLERQRDGATLLVRTAGGAPNIPQALRQHMQSVQPDLRMREAIPFQSIVLQQMVRERLLAVLSAFFAVLALVVAVVGLYSVLNYAVTRERRDIALRMALGARPGHVVTLITTRLLGMVLLGMAAGVASGIGFGRFVQTLLFQLQPTEVAALAPPVGVLLLATTLAVLPPALRAVRTDPARVIGTEG